MTVRTEFVPFELHPLLMQFRIENESNQLCFMSICRSFCCLQKAERTQLFTMWIGNSMHNEIYTRKSCKSHQRPCKTKDIFLRSRMDLNHEPIGDIAATLRSVLTAECATVCATEARDIFAKQICAAARIGRKVLRAIGKDPGAIDRSYRTFRDKSPKFF